MVPRCVLCSMTLIALLLAPAGFAQEQFPANADFAAGLNDWNAPEGHGLEGGALSLTGGTAVSDASAEPLAGWRRVEVRIKGPGRRSDSSLGLGLTPADGEVRLQAAVTAAEAGDGWHTLTAELLPPPGVPASVAIGVEGEGRWLIESVVVTPLAVARPGPSKFEAVVPDALPESWEPEGLLDAIERPIARSVELLVPVGALEIGMPAAVETVRGHRGWVPLIVRNRATTERTLTVSVAGPPGFFAPDRTITVASSKDTVFRASVQAFFVGTRTARMTFRSSDEEASAPIRVTVEPSYPAPGISFTDRAISGRMLDALPAASVALVAAPPGVALPERLTRLRLLPLPWSEDALQSAAAHAAGNTEFIALSHARDESPESNAGAATMLLRRALNETAPAVSTLGPPVDLTPGPPPRVEQESLALIGDLAGAVSAPTLRLPVLEARPARAVSLDRKPVESAQPSWTELARALSIDAAAAAVRGKARLPLFFGDLAARTSGSPEVDAAILARTLVLCAWQGATGWTIPAQAADAPDDAAAFAAFDEDGGMNGAVAQAYSELSRELAAAVPLVVLKQTPEIGAAVDAQVGFRPFIRNDEGILAMWNNTGAPVDLAVEVRVPPLDLHTLTIGVDGVRREYIGAYRFSNDAITLNRPVIFVTLQPAELKVLSMQLANPHMGWLASVERKPQIVRTGGERKGFLERWSGEENYR